MDKTFSGILNEERIKPIRDKWKGKLVLKGVASEQDTKDAIRMGFDGIIVSNHGGRQLDGAAASIDVLGPIVDAVGDKLEVYMDSGIRSGQDVFKAMALGAKSTFIGRAFIYGLGAMGEKGVQKALEIIHGELDKTMGFAGETDIENVGRHNLLWC